KYSLWDGADTALAIANALNNETHRDALNDPASFSIVNVHPWSTLGPTGSGSGDPMSNLNQLVQWLDPAKGEGVTLEGLMVHLRTNFGMPVWVAPDLDADGDVDSDDLALFSSCKTRAGVPASGTPLCQRADFDHDGDVDQNDFAIYQRCYSGTNVPAKPTCG